MIKGVVHNINMFSFMTDGLSQRWYSEVQRIAMAHAHVASCMSGTNATSGSCSYLLSEGLPVACHGSRSKGPSRDTADYHRTALLTCAIGFDRESVTQLTARQMSFISGAIYRIIPVRLDSLPGEHSEKQCRVGRRGYFKLSCCYFQNTVLCLHKCKWKIHNMQMFHDFCRLHLR